MNISERHIISDGQGYLRSTRLSGNAHNRVRLHRVIAEGVLGRSLPPHAVVHHVDDDGEHNANSNLVILESQSEHMKMHYRRSVLRAGGHPFNDAICDLCRQVGPKTECYRLGASGSWRHRSCHRDYERQRREKHKDEINARSRARRRERRDGGPR